METSEYVLFFGHQPNNLGINIFSQWYQIKFIEKFDKHTIIEYNNAEQYMMAHKALLFGDADNYEKIMNTSDPGQIKRFGRAIKGFDPDIWNEHKFDIVVNGNRLKFGQNKSLMDRLLKTNNKFIAEASPYDRIWGNGLTANLAIKTPQNKWPGQNLLGHALMVVRDENLAAKKLIN